LKDTRFASYFEVIGNGENHLGQFPNCKAPDIFGSVIEDTAASTGSSCC